MPATAEQNISLSDLREKSGLRLREIMERARAIDDQFPATHNALLNFEEDGTRDYWKLLALSTIYGVPLHELAVIAKPKRK